MQENKDYPVQEPTIGRIVHYWDTVEQKIPFPAMVQAAVPGSLTITCLHVYLHDGTRIEYNVPHMLGEASGFSSKGRWDWMAFQKGQAAKTEQLEKKLESEIAQMAKSVGAAAQQGLATRKQSDADWDSDRLKTHRSTPSPEDGKR